MKVILTGSTGFIGAEVLRQCLTNPSITSIIALSRRDLPISDPKLKTLILKDWTSYEPTVLTELQGAEACIWSLGVKTTDITIQKLVTLDYTMAFLSAISSLQSSSPTSRAPFRFVFTSGVLAVRDASAPAWFFPGARHIKGEGESAVLAFASAHEATLDGIVVRPGGVTDGGCVSGGLGAIGVPIIGVQPLSAAMVTLAVKGAGEKKVWENGELAKLGREILNRKEGD